MSCTLLSMKRRVTLRDIARKAGVHYATVSRALRKDPRIGKAMVAKIQALAQKLGYVPDPMLSGLSAYRSLKGMVGYQATLAWVTNAFTRDGWSTFGWSDFDIIRLYFQGASERAAALGYRLEEFWLREPGMTPRRASQILRTRGISGLIVSPQPKQKMRIRLDWENFSAVSMGYSLAWPRLHVVTNYQFQSMMTTVRQVRAHGYRRIGLAINPNDERVDHGWTGGFLALQQYWPAKDRIPIFSYVNFSPERLEAWIQRYRPEAIVGYGSLVAQLEELGHRVPEEIGVATHSLGSVSEKCAGIDENARITGAQAVDLVVTMIHRGERGIPEFPQRILTEGSWREGETLKFRYRGAD